MYDELAEIARREFGDIVTSHQLFYRRAAIPLNEAAFITSGWYLCGRLA
jgi:hypothetical protein